MLINPFANSIYGPGVLNDTVVPGYPATLSPVNLSVFSSLPNGTTRNYGQSTQYVTYPQGYPNYMYALAQQYTDMNHIRMWNPMLYGTGLNLNSGNETDPAAIQAGLALAAQAGIDFTNQLLAQKVNAEINASVQNIAQTLAQMGNAIKQYLKSDKVSAAQKASLEKLQEKVKAKKEEIEAKMKEKELTQEDVKAIQKDLAENLAKEVTDTLAEIKEKVEKGDNTAPSDKSKGDKNSDDKKSDDGKSTDVNTGKPSGYTTPSSSECQDFCSQICTNNSGKIKEAVNKIDKNNVIEFISCWEKGYNTGNKENVFDRIFKNLNDNEQNEIVPLILKALTQRAEDLGIYKDIEGLVGKVNKGLSKTTLFGMMTWHDDKTLAQDLMAIYKKIEAKEKTNKTKASKQEKTDKAKNDKNAKERKAQVVNEKRSEFAAELKAALKLDEMPEVTTALKVDTDDNGEFTGYSIKVKNKNGEFVLKGATYKQLIAELEKHGLEAKMLVKKDVKA